MAKKKEVLEQVRDHVKLIVEQNSSIKEEITDLKTDFTIRFDRLEVAIMENNRKIRDVDIKVNIIDRKLETAITNHESRMRSLENKIG